MISKQTVFKMLNSFTVFYLMCVVCKSYAYEDYSTNGDTADFEPVNVSNTHPSLEEPPDLVGCCRRAFSACRLSCENLSLSRLATTNNFIGNEVALSDLRRNCPSTQNDLWQCVNHTLYAITRGAEWAGRICCSHAVAIECGNACATSTSVQETQTSCRRSDEQKLFECFARQENGDNCCGNARSSECLNACRDIFQSERAITKEHRTHIEQVCNEDNTNMKVLRCLEEVMVMTPAENPKQYLPCCGKSRSAICRETCRNILVIGETIQEIVDALEKGGCGAPLPHDPLWQCFLADGHVQNPSENGITSQINQIGMDSAKLHCCHKAQSPKCRRLCVQTFSNDWFETHRDFENDCYNQFNEVSLKQCLDEVDEPCELGCDGLSFCTNFNNRPTELFRSCNINSDYAAQTDLEVWRGNQTLSLPGLYLPIKDIERCAPESWQAISCLLQIKPCSRDKHVTQLCYEDCYDLLTECIDWSRMETRHTPQSICTRFTVDSDDLSMPCTSLKPYLQPSDLVNEWPAKNPQIIMPCRGHTCNTSEICVADNKRDRHGIGAAEHYRCVPGCALGETSTYMIPFGSYARIPVSSKEKGCFKICKCQADGKFDECQQLPCMSYDSCVLGDRHVQHGSWFSIECNICSCFAGDITCTRKQCRMPGISEHYTSIPCNCGPHYIPVCGRNGYTYPSECVSKCAGLQVHDIEYRACRENNPCRDAKCPANTQCIENRQICLSVMHKPCRQYQCVNTSTSCGDTDKPVCSSEGHTYRSICHLIEAKTTLAYAGRCIDSCRNTPVCGINGISYKNECEAWSDYSLADYDGECREIGLLTSTLGHRCNSVRCNINDNCSDNLIIPPGACCPVCGTAIRIIYSRKQIDRVLFALRGQNTEIVTLKGILIALDNLIHVSHCRLSGFLTIESDIFVVVHTIGMGLSQLHFEACSREAEKIATHIDTQTHRITSDLALSALTVANVVRPDDFDVQFNLAISIRSCLTLVFIPFVLSRLIAF